MRELDYTVHKAPRATFRHQNAVIFAAYPFAAGEADRSEGYDVIARETGLDVVCAHATGTEKIYINQSERKKLSKGDLYELAGEDAVNIKKWLGHIPVYALLDSGRAPWGAAAQLHNPSLFTNMTIRDGVNLYGPEGVVGGAYRLFRHGGDRGTSGPSTVPPQVQSRASRLYSIGCGVAEAYRLRKIICGPTSISAQRMLAAQRDTPVHNVTVAYGIGGSEKMVLAFNNELERIRNSQKQHPDDDVAPFLHTHEETWGHGNLPDPYGAAKHVLYTLAETGIIPEYAS